MTSDVRMGVGPSSITFLVSYSPLVIHSVHSREAEPRNVRDEDPTRREWERRAYGTGKHRERRAVSPSLPPLSSRPFPHSHHSLLHSSALFVPILVPNGVSE